MGNADHTKATGPGVSRRCICVVQAVPRVSVFENSQAWEQPAVESLMARVTSAKVIKSAAILALGEAYGDQKAFL